MRLCGVRAYADLEMLRSRAVSRTELRKDVNEKEKDAREDSCRSYLRRWLVRSRMVSMGSNGRS